MLVLQMWMDIINFTREPKKLEDIANEIGYDNNHMSRILNYLIGRGCIVQKAYYFKSIKQDYVISTHNKIKAESMILGDRIEIPPIFVDLPSLDICEQVKALVKQNVSRSQIARQLNIKKTQVLWAVTTYAGQKCSDKTPEGS
jgi:predicted transcriptional regulator